MFKIKKLLIFIILLTPLYIYFSFTDIMENWKITIISIIIVLFLQLGVGFFISKFYKKIIDNNSIFFTILSVYVYSVTLFFLFIIILIKFFRIII